MNCGRTVNRRSAIWWTGAALGLLLACQGGPPERPGKVGIVERQWSDPGRQRWDGSGEWPLSATIWYPAQDSAAEDALSLGPPGLPVFQQGYAAAEAALLAPATRRPLVLLSHGTGGSGRDLSWLAEWLVARGYLAAAITHHGNSIASDDLSAQGFFLFWERPRDLALLLDHLLADPLFGPSIDPERIGAAGFSLGGNTVALLAGGRLDTETYYAFCQSPAAQATSCEPPPESPFGIDDLLALIEQDDPMVRASLLRADESHRDPRVRAAYAIAPAVIDAMPAAGAKAIGVPIRIVVGDRDELAPADTNARVLARDAPQAELWVLPDVGHYTFLSRCGWAGRLVLGDLCEEQPGVDRAAIHALIAGDAYEFFERTLP
ncbi:MAG: peptidase [Myxococcota bacterium]|nr:peptidase [Myxococcota bacterium]